MVFKKQKNQEPVNPSLVLNPEQKQDEFSQQIYQQPVEQEKSQQQPIQQQEPQQFQQPIQQPQTQQVKPTQSAVITKVELTENQTIKFEGEANYLINLGDCQIIK